MLFVQSLPLLALVGLLASGRAGPAWSCLAALALAMPAAWLHVEDTALFGHFLGTSVLEGLWLAAIPVGIITGGLVFHAGVQRAPRADATAVIGAGETVDRAFTIAFCLGMFAEAATGFGVGTVFAIGALRKLGLGGAPAAAIGLLAQTAIPWGGLGPGTAIGAAMAGIDAQALASRNAALLAPSLLLLAPLFWWWCRKAGLTVSARTMLRQFLWLAQLGGLLVAFHAVLPWQLCGMLASGGVLSARTLLANPPRGWPDVARLAAEAAPYLLLVGLLMAGQAWHEAPALRPLPGLPALGLGHPMVAIWVSAILLLALRGGRVGTVLTALQRARQPALALLSFVVLARVLSNAGIPVALATAMVAGFGAAAPFAAPILAAIAGFFAGTNVGSNAAMMTLQAELGRASGLGPLVLPAVQNGTLALVISPQLTAVASGLMAEGGSSRVTPGALWRIMWPVVVIALVVGTVSIWVG